MLRDDFFTVLSIDTEGASVKAVLELNPDHAIFKGHFPDMPVVPGVCMMQMVKEIAEISVGETLMLSKADSMKFLSVIDPGVNKVVKIGVSYKAKDAAIDVNASIATEERVCFKFRGIFIKTPYHPIP